MKRILEIGKDPEHRVVELEIELRRKESVHPHLSTDLEPCHEYTELSICGNIWNHRRTDCVCCGQIRDVIRKELFGYKKLFISKEKILRILDVWEEWHLNGMQAGTKAQSAALKASGEVNPDYDRQCKILEDAGLLVDNGYRYGTAWLVTPLPEEIEAEVRTWEQTRPVEPPKKKKKPMALRTFIRQNRKDIDAAIKRANPGRVRINDEERRLWILNDEGLYNWARDCGVDI